MFVTNSLGAFVEIGVGNAGEALTSTSTGIAFASFSGGDTTSPGLVIPFAGSSVPAGWLLCDGSAMDRAIYANLFAVIGTTYGAGNGSTDFNLPDFRGRMPVGAGTGSGLTTRVLGESGGSESVVLAEQNLASHTHTYTYRSAQVSYLNTYKYIWIDTAAAVTGSTGGGGAHNNMMPYTVTNFIIKT